jgi:hypothetical protein
MSAQANVIPLSRRSKTSDDVPIHVRFYPNADIATVDERPADLGNYDWFVRLQEGASQHYRTFAGGRGFFRIPRDLRGHRRRALNVSGVGPAGPRGV